MSRGVNRAIILGNVGNDPDMNQTQGGTQIANISIATSEVWKDKNTGQQQERTEWHRVTFFGRLAEVVGQYIKKGSKVYIEGRIQTDQYEKGGVKMYATKIIANELQMLDSKPQGDGQKPQQGQQGQQQAPQGGQAKQDDGLDEDDLPF